MSLFGKVSVVTREIIDQPWMGGKNGKYFRCALCGHKFVVGDTFRAVFTNNISGAGGNPLIGECCDGTDEQVIDKWRQMHKDIKEKYWWFNRRQE